MFNQTTKHETMDIINDAIEHILEYLSNAYFDKYEKINGMDLTGDKEQSSREKNYCSPKCIGYPDKSITRS